MYQLTPEQLELLKWEKSCGNIMLTFSLIEGMEVLESRWTHNEQWPSWEKRKVKYFWFRYRDKRFVKIIHFNPQLNEFCSIRHWLAKLRGEYLPRMVKNTIEWYDKSCVLE